MWLVIILGVVILVYLLGHYSHKHDINKKTGEQGGMLIKYDSLIEELKRHDLRTTIYKVTGNSVLLGVKDSYDVALFTMVQDDNAVNVTYKLKNKMLDLQFELRWEFPDNLDQSLMAGKIRSDIQSKNMKHLELINGNKSGRNEIPMGSYHNKFIVDEQNKSMEIIAAKLDCKVSEAKGKYFKKMTELDPEETNIETLKTQLKLKAEIESDLYNNTSLNN